MLVPGIHSDSKIKLQEEVCTRNRSFESLTDWQMFGIPFLFFFSFVFRVLSLWSSQFRLVSVGFRRAARAFVGTEEKQSDSSEHTLLLVPSALDTKKVR